MKSIKRVWCSCCIKKRPPIIQKADFLIPARSGHYCLIDGTASIDNRLIGICKECLSEKNDFQKKNTQPVDVNHPNLIRTNGGF